MDIEKLKALFLQKYGEAKQITRVYFSPGRVNLIGEHTDYNNGFVLPCALTYGTYLLARKNDDNMLRLSSVNFEAAFEIPLDKLREKLPGQWAMYPLGVIDQLRQKGMEPFGLDLLYAGNIPNGAGLSSSASVEMVTAFALNHIADCDLNMLELVKLAQKAENEFVGVNCGIMDQFAVGMGKKDYAVFLDCSTLAYDLVPLDVAGFRLVIMNTNKKRGLAGSKYNERVDECAKATAYLAKAKKINSLGELSYPEFMDLSQQIPDERIRQRAAHVISENQRVLDAVTALKSHDLKKFGELMNASHDSLRDDYEVTGPELDAMVEEARNADGVLGARMTGAGFGGCAISLVKENNIDAFIRNLGKGYFDRTGLKADFYLSEIGDGTRFLS